MEKITQKYELSFEWQKPAAGYKWEDCDPCDFWGKPFKDWEKEKRADFEAMIQSIPGGPYLTEADSASGSISWEPLANPLLFAQFADIQPDVKSFLDWANGHGRLIDSVGDIGSYIFIFPEFTPVDENDLILQINKGAYIIENGGRYYRRVKADSADFWVTEYHELSRAVMLWEMSAKKDKRLSGILDWAHDGVDIYLYKIRRQFLDEIDFERFRNDDGYRVDCTYGRILIPPYYQGVENPLPWMEYFKGKFDAVKAVSMYLQQEITRKLTEYPLKLSFKRDVRGELRKVLQPTSLLSVMWYQFYLALTGDIQLRRCSLCGKWENMEGHRSTWSKHANCANYGRVKRARNKKKRELS